MLGRNVGLPVSSTLRWLMLDMNDGSAQTLIDPTLLFRFEIELQHHRLKWTNKGIDLDEDCRVPSFAELAGRPSFADVRMAWDESGLGFDMRVSGKRSVPWCRDTRLEDSDGFHLWLDTRCSPGIHRATQYCHRLLFMPSGGGGRREDAVAALIPINRARQNPRSITGPGLRVLATVRHDGYRLAGLIPTTALTGFDPGEQPRLGYFYAVIDRELGWQTFSLGPEYPVTEDPSLWGQAVLANG